MNPLQNEYIKRHNIQHLCPLTEGVLFFEKNKKPHSVCLISSRHKGLRSCPVCSTTNEFIFEWFILDKFPRLHYDVMHQHITPDVNLFDFFKEHLPADCTPYVSKGDRDQEEWLWKALTSVDRFSASGSSIAKKAQSCTDRSNTWLASIIYILQNSPDTFNTLYEHYSYCLINRKYLLVG
jgi:hypothetical protein